MKRSMMTAFLCVCGFGLAGCQGDTMYVVHGGGNEEGGQTRHPVETKQAGIPVGIPVGMKQVGIPVGIPEGTKQAGMPAGIPAGILVWTPGLIRVFRETWLAVWRRGWKNTRVWRGTAIVRRIRIRSAKIIIIIFQNFVRTNRFVMKI